MQQASETLNDLHAAKAREAQLSLDLAEAVDALSDPCDKDSGCPIAKARENGKRILASSDSDMAQRHRLAWMVVQFVDDLLHDRANPADVWHQIELSMGKLDKLGALNQN